MKSEELIQQTLRLYTEDEAGSTVVLSAMPKRHHYRERFRTMFVSQMETVAQWDRPAVYHRVLWHLMAKLDPIQWRVTSAAKIAEACAISQVSAERALAMLVADKIILQQGGNAQRERRLNNNLAWSSSAQRHNEVESDEQPEDARGR